MARALDNRMCTFASRALARLGRSNVLRLCIAMSRSPKDWMAFSGAHLLAGLRDSQYLPLFSELWQHASADVRAKAREGIEQLAEEGDAQPRRRSPAWRRKSLPRAGPR